MKKGHAVRRDPTNTPRNQIALHISDSPPHILRQTNGCTPYQAHPFRRLSLSHSGGSAPKPSVTYDRRTSIIVAFILSYGLRCCQLFFSKKRPIMPFFDIIGRFSTIRACRSQVKFSCRTLFLVAIYAGFNDLVCLYISQNLIDRCLLALEAFVYRKEMPDFLKCV